MNGRICSPEGLDAGPSARARPPWAGYGVESTLHAPGVGRRSSDGRGLAWLVLTHYSTRQPLPSHGGYRPGRHNGWLCNSITSVPIGEDSIAPRDTGQGRNKGIVSFVGCVNEVYGFQTNTFEYRVSLVRTTAKPDE